MNTETLASDIIASTVISVWAPAHNGNMYGYTRYYANGKSEFVQCDEVAIGDEIRWLRKRVVQLQAEGEGEFAVAGNCVVRIETLQAAQFTVDEQGKISAYITVNDPERGSYGGMSIYLN
jgi:hypothetical protein